MRKLDRLLKKLENQYDYGMITDEEIAKITSLYFSMYQEDTIVRDIANINRMTEDSFDYNDIEKDEYNYINVKDENLLFDIVKEIIASKIRDGNY